MPQLVFSTQEGQSQAFEITNGSVTIGRDADNVISLQDNSVSGCHALINTVNKTIWLRDLNSSNGTFVNGSPVTHVELHEADVVRFGNVKAPYEHRPNLRSRRVKEYLVQEKPG